MIKTWQERYAEIGDATYPIGSLVAEEIAELRAENAALLAANRDSMDHYHELRTELEKIKVQPVPEGMVLVPITPTDPMLEKLAYMGRSRVVSGPNKSDWEPAAIRHWKAMLEAAKDKP